MFKLFKPFISYRSIWNAVKVMLTDQIAEGKEVKKFEEEFADFHGWDKDHVVAVNSCTSGLEIAYDLLGIKRNDEVIAPLFTCVATNVPLARRKAKIVFADIASDFNMDVADIEKKITPKTKAIVFVHMGGNSRGIFDVVRLAEKYNIPVIEDAAQALGNYDWGIGDIAVTSLQAVKIITSGDGGVMYVKDRDLAKKARRLRWYGHDRELRQKNGDAPLEEAGYKMHMNNITAAIARGNMVHLKRLAEGRRDVAEVYANSAYCIMANIRLSIFLMKNKEMRDFVMAYLKENGIETGIHHYRNDKYGIFGGKKKKFPNMDKFDDRYFLVPNHHEISESDAWWIVENINCAAEAYERIPKPVCSV